MFIKILHEIFFQKYSTILNGSLKPRDYMEIENRTTFAHNILLAYIETTYFLANNFLTNLDPFLFN